MLYNAGDYILYYMGAKPGIYNEPFKYIASNKKLDKTCCLLGDNDINFYILRKAKHQDFIPYILKENFIHRGGFKNYPYVYEVCNMTLFGKPVSENNKLDLINENKNDS